MSVSVGIGLENRCGLELEDMVGSFGVYLLVFNGSVLWRETGRGALVDKGSVGTRRFERNCCGAGEPRGVGVVAERIERAEVSRGSIHAVSKHSFLG